MLINVRCDVKEEQAVEGKQGKGKKKKRQGNGDGATSICFLTANNIQLGSQDAIARQEVQ